eukprot:945068_1
MQFQKFICITLFIDLINGQAFTSSPIVGTMDISTCGTVYSKNTIDTVRTESYSFTSNLFYENITFTTCGSAFDTTLRLYKYVSNWTDIAYLDDESSCNPQTELVLHDLSPGDYVLELSSFNADTYGFYTLTTQDCILGTVQQTSGAPTTTIPIVAKTTIWNWLQQPVRNENGEAGSSDDSGSGIATDLLIQVLIGLAVYAIIPCIFFCAQNTCCKEEENE